MAFSCADIDTLVHAYLDGELAIHDLEELEQHMAVCAACKGRVDEELQFRAELRRKLTPPRTPDLLKARVRALLDAEDRAATTAQRRRNIAWVLPGAASVAAAAALVLVFALPSKSDDSPRPANGNAPGRPAPEVGALPQRIPVPDLAAFGAKPSSFSQARGRADITYESDRNHARHQFQLSIIPDARGLKPSGQRIDLDGIDLDGVQLWLAPLGGQTAITILRGSNAFILQSQTMPEEQMLEIIRQSGNSWLRHAPDPQP